MSHLERLLVELDRDDAYPHASDRRETHQTHISVVFLAGDFAYKLKKPVDFGFVDYGDLERRRHFCRREVELNRRLAEDVYLGVWAVVERDGRWVLRDADSVDESQVVEWAVRMRRLDEDLTLGKRLARGELARGSLSRLGGHIARFHRAADRDDEIAAFASFEAVAKNALENFSQTRAHVGLTVKPEVHARLERLFEATLSDKRATIDARQAANVPCDTHGDLRLEHVHIDRDGEIRIVDCVEFNDAFRFADPVSDIAFLSMDLLIRGYHAESADILDDYFTVREDPRGRSLLPLYVAYRSAVRAKVHGLKADEAEVPESERASAKQRSRMHWNFALRVLAPPRRRPRLLLVGGLPGTGKSTVARELKARGWIDDIIDTDKVRKGLAGLEDKASARDDFEGGIYTEAWTQKTYAECRRRARSALAKGRRVVVDASFRHEAHRDDFAELGLAMGVPPVFIECALPDDVVRERLSAREADISDADVEVYDRMRDQWDTPGERTRRFHLVLPTTGTVADVSQRAVNLLRDHEDALFD
jgi:hypothetical protein